ncbi:hypothetical protein BBJ28_00020996 [Nothophytophthora sp. Chile5]|nr:hypothetical protein BBJ28_00020996 [Nothophytophthora sp. Chile5]
MSDRKRRKVAEDARRLELCAEDLRELGASIGACAFRRSVARAPVPLRAPSDASSASKPPSKASRPAATTSSSLYSLVSSAAYAAKTNAAFQQESWLQALQRLAAEMDAAGSSSEASERCDRLKRRHESLAATVRVCQERVRRLADEVGMQDRVESQLAEEETAWETQMQAREQRVAEREVELAALQEENADDTNEEEDDDQEDEEEAEHGELREVLALRAEEKRDIEAAIESMQRKKRRRGSVLPSGGGGGDEDEDVDMAANATIAAREQVLRELREEKEVLQREIIATEEKEEQQEENQLELPALKEAVVEAKRERAQVQERVDSLRLELERRKRKMRHMVDVQLLTARDTNPPVLREEAVLLHLLYEHEGEMGVNELKQETSAVLQAHGKAHGNGVVIRALYSLVANGVVQIDRSYGNGLVTSLLV